jgi:hypothetical protein
VTDSYFPVIVKNMSKTQFYFPSEIERLTGFGNNHLRKWRQRFGFPPKESNPFGKVGFSLTTVDHLLLIKSLLEAGFRPAQVVGKSVIELEKLKLAMNLNIQSVIPAELTINFIDCIRRFNFSDFVVLLAEKRHTQTMLDFVQSTITPLMISIGDAWKCDEIEIYHEHLCTAYVERFLQSEIIKFLPKQGFPVILFCLPPGEHHSIGLFLAEAVLAEQGAFTINIGTDIPLNNLKLVSILCKADVVALSFSNAYPARDVLPTLKRIRRLLLPHIQIWAGGAGLSAIRKIPNGVKIFYDFNEVIIALNEIPLH